MLQEDVWDEEAARRYDTPGTGTFAPEVLDPAVDRLVDLAVGGPALEFAIGTGRIAIPLAPRGVPVSGIGLSAPMVQQLRSKVNERTIPVVPVTWRTPACPASSRSSISSSTPSPSS